MTRAVRLKSFPLWLTAILFAGTGCSVQHDLSMARRAADEFHQSMQAHRDGGIMVEVDPQYYRSVSREARRNYLARVQDVLGAPVSWSMAGTHVDHMQSGTFVSARFLTRFENGTAQEDFSWRVDKDRLLLVAYVVSNSSSDQ